jgi:outer membrane protein TolC
VGAALLISAAAAAQQEPGISSAPAAGAAAGRETLTLTRAEAERDSVRGSDKLKAAVEETKAAQEKAASSLGDLVPTLSFDGYYRHHSEVPELDAFGQHFPFGAHENYAYGGMLRYTVFDGLSNYQAWKGSKELAQSRDYARRTDTLALLLEARNDYVKVQELLEELAAVADSLSLSRQHHEDILTRLRGGAASRLDSVESQREITSNEIQFAQTQNALAKALKDLLALTRDRSPKDLSHPGPPGVESVTLELRFDPLLKSIDELKAFQPTPPDDGHPRILTQDLQARALDLEAKSVKAGLWPKVDAWFYASNQYPDGPVVRQVNQNIVGVKGSLPIFEMNKTLHASREKARLAASTRSQLDQTRVDLRRDYDKALETLESLRRQQELAAQDVQNSAEAARLYYQQYKGGKAQIIDVQTADNRALLSRVNKSRIDAQILNQLDLLRALAGKEISE